MFALVDQWKSSGVIRKAFCAEHAINIHTFSYWLAKRRRADQPSGGFVLYYKRLEEGTFVPPTVEGDQTVVRWPELVLMVEGITVQRSSQGRRYQR